MTQGTVYGVPIDTDPTMALNSNQVVPSQAAVVTYVANNSAKTLTGDTGGSISPSAGNFNLLGSGSITTVGSGSTVTTQLTGLTNHALLVGAGTSTITKLAIGSTGQVLQGNTAADPTFSTATYPSVATGTGTLLRANGTNWVASTSTYPDTNAVSTLLYASAANVMSALATANDGVLITNSTGVPSISNALTISNSATTLATLTCTDAGAATGPIVDLYRNSASPAAADVLASIPFNGVDSGAAKQEYARIEARIIATTAGAENGGLQFNTVSAGTSTKQVDLLNTGGQYRGNNTNTAPPAGFIGEQITSSVTGISLANGTPKTLTSIDLTTGIWDISCTSTSVAGGITTAAKCGINTTTNAFAGVTAQESVFNSPAGLYVNITNVVPQFRATLSGTTTYYLVGQGNFTTSTMTMNGRITATRVG